MNRAVVVLASLALTGPATLLPACRGADGKTTDAPNIAPAIAVAAEAVVERSVTRYVRATGSLMAEEQAGVAAEIAGRVESTPVERGTPVNQGDILIRLSVSDADAQAKEAEANAAQIEARLGLVPGATFDSSVVPEVQHAKASLELAQNEFARIKTLLDERVVSQSEFEQRRTQLEAARQQYEVAKNGAAQQFQMLQAAQARVTLAHKALADTTVRAPFNGLVAERLVSVGDYVTKGMKVAVVVRVNPLRLQLTVPEQFISVVAVGVPVSFTVDAYPGREFVGKVRYVSPALEANVRALTIEAIVSNVGGELKPGLFATARITEQQQARVIVVPASAIQTNGGTSRVFVINGDHAEERIVTIGQTVETQVEITTGLKTGDRVATRNVAQLVDGIKVS